jgi:hypothetical protein
MRIFRSWAPESASVVERIGGTGCENLDLQRRQEQADVVGVARCPRCGDVLVARMRCGRPTILCRCPVRRVRALALPA